MAGAGNVQVDSAPLWERRWGVGDTERCYKNEQLMMEGRQEEEGIYKYTETVETGEAGEDRIKLFKIATEPRYVAVTV